MPHIPLRLSALALSALLVSSCSRDLSIPPAPPPPERGGVTGHIDTAGLRSPADRTVTLISAAGAKRTAMTDATGAFAFDDLLPGAFILDVRVTGFAPLVEAGVVVEGGQTTDVGVLTLTWLEGAPELGGIKGTVEIQGGVGDPTGGRVEFTPAGETTPWSSAVIGFGGSYELRVPPGSWKIRAFHPWFISSPEATVVVPEGTVVTAPMPLSLDVNPATISGHILRERDLSTPTDAAGALITFDTGVTTTADAQGHFQMTGLPAGRRTFRVTLAGHHDDGLATGLDVTGGAQVDAPDITLSLDRGTIRGMVEMADGQPARDVDVTLEGTPYAASVSPVATALERAEFVISRVPAGVYTVAASRTRYSRQQATSITVGRDTITDVGTLHLTLLQGDFVIDDGVAGNAAGFAKQRAVTLDFSGFSNAARVRFSQTDPTLASATWQSWAAAVPYTLQGGDGTKTLYAQYEDSSMQASAVFQSSIVLDTTPPASSSITLAGGAPFTNQASSLTVTLFAVDPIDSSDAGVDAVSGVTKVHLSASNATDSNGELLGPRDDYRVDTSFTRPPPQGDGAQRVYAQFIDAAGNLGPIVFDDVVVDTVPPSGSLVIAQGPRATSPEFTDTLIAELRLTVGNEPDGGSVSVRLANDATDVPRATLQAARGSVAWFLDPTGEGVKTVAFELVDAAGNRTTGTPDTITYDITPPTASATLLGTSPTRDAGVTIQLAATDLNGLSPTQAVTVSEDTFFAAAGTSTPAPFPVNSRVTATLSAGDGQKSVYVRLRDVAGNDAVASVRVELDTTPPVGSLTVTGALANGTPSTTMTATTAVTVGLLTSGATGYRLGDATLTTCPDPLITAYTPITSGQVSHTLTGSGSPRTVRACLSDAAGNTTLTAATTIGFDNTPPASCALTLSGRTVAGVTVPPDSMGIRRSAQRNVDATITCMGGEVPADVFFTQGSVTCTSAAPLDWAAWSGQRVSLTGSDGSFTISGCVRDAAGNAASFTSGTIVLDTTGPQGVVVSIEDDAAYFNEALRTTRGGFTANVKGISSDAVRWAVAQSPPTATTLAFTQGVATPVSITTGQGQATIWAVFEDALGNLSAPVFDIIMVDTLAPSTAGATLSIRSPTGNGYTNSPAVVLDVVPPSDATAVQLGQAASPSACVVGDVSGDSMRQIVGSYVWTLVGIDETKRLCARFFDAAGNPSATATSGTLVSGTVMLDTTPPSTPQISTPSATVRVANNTVFYVNTVAGVTESNFYRYEKLGGADTTWTQADLSQPQTLFQFTLLNDGSEEGLANVLRLRARDYAGNVSGESLVVITADTNFPAAVTVNPLWVDNGDGQVTFWYQPDLTASPDIVAVRIEYDSVASKPVYNGTYAAQGPSPILVPTQSSTGSFTLSGLSNGSPTYVRIRAVDRAGNLGPLPSGPPVLLQPNEVSPTLVSNLTMPASVGRVLRMVSQGNTLYAVSMDGANTCTSIETRGIQLHAIDLRSLQSPIQGNQIVSSPAVPAILWSSPVFPDAVPCTGPGNLPVVDLAFDGSYAFLASGTNVRIIDVDKYAATPSDRLVATLNVTTLPSGAAFRARSVWPLGGRLVVHGGATAGSMFTSVVNLSKLYDADAGSVVTLPGDAVGTATRAGFNASNTSVLTRDRLLGFLPTSQFYNGFKLGDGLDADGGSVFDSTDLMYAVDPGGVLDPESRPPVSGNYTYLASGSAGLTVFDLTNSWASTPTAVTFKAGTAFPATGQYEVWGNQAFIANNGVFRVLDFTDLSDVRETCVFDTGSDITSAVHVFGPYAVVAVHLVGSSNFSLQFLELATPRSMKVRRSGVGAGERPRVNGSFVVTSEGKAFDTQSAPLANAWGGPSFCTSSGSAQVDDLEVLAAGSKMTVWNLENALDRNLVTAPLAANDSYDVTMPAGTRVTDVALWGNFLVASEVRTTGIWVEVFDATVLRDRDPTTKMTAGDSRGSYQVAASPSSGSTFAYVTMNAGRAMVMVEDQSQAINTQGGGWIYFVDLRPLLDDNSAGMTVDSLQGTVVSTLGNPLYRARGGVMRGNRASVATTSNIVGLDISAVMDEDPLTKVTNPTLTVVTSGQFDDVTASGSYLFTSASNAGPMRSLDIGGPVPEPLSVIPINTTTTTTCTIDGVSRNVRVGVTQVGSRAWVTTPGTIREIDLE